jgi:hypothetical protein
MKLIIVHVRNRIIFSQQKSFLIHNTEA